MELKTRYRNKSPSLVHSPLVTLAETYDPCKTNIRVSGWEATDLPALVHLIRDGALHPAGETRVDPDDPNPGTQEDNEDDPFGIRPRQDHRIRR